MSLVSQEKTSYNVLFVYTICRYILYARIGRCAVQAQKELS